MPNLSLKLEKLTKEKAIFSALFLFLMVAFPIFAFSSHSHNIYVDANASGMADGSSAHPYNTISKALKNADESSEIHISKGTYKENIDIKKGVELYGSDEEDVIIEADENDQAAVTMANKTVINKVTVKGGKIGIKIKDNAKASISKCIVKGSKNEGVKVEGGDVNKSRLVSITESVIKNNKRAGIYSAKRKLSIMDNEIRENLGDGVFLEAGSDAWISGNKIFHNEKSGMVVTIDGSNIWTKSNTYKNNDREGIEVSFYGGSGRINIAKSKFMANEMNAVGRVQRKGYYSESNWVKFLTFDNRNEFSGNIKSNISKVFMIR